MPWMELSLDTTHEGVDWVCTLLAATNYTDDIVIANTDPDLSCSWAFTIRLYLVDDGKTNARIEKIVNLLLPLHRTGLSSDVAIAFVEEKPVHPEVKIEQHRIGQRFVVLNSDTPYESQKPDEVIIRLKTSLAFGSGFHPATILCLRLLERYIFPTMNVLDLGSGSGILSVAMALLGANVLALDNDSVAVQATQDAVSRNKVDKQVTVRSGSLGCGSDMGHWMGSSTLDNVPTINATASFDLIVANILARMHIALAQDLQRALRRTDSHSGILITAGFTTDYEDEVSTALMESGFETVDCERLNEWVALAHRLKV